MKKFLIVATLFILLYVTFIGLFVGFKAMANDSIISKEETKQVYTGGYLVKFEDSVWEGKFYRHVIIEKSGLTISVKDCSAPEILLPVEVQVCSTGRKTI